MEKPLPRSDARLAVAGVVLVVMACGGVPRSTDFFLHVSAPPTAPVVNRATQLEVTLRDRAHRSWPGARLQLELHMPHPGMAPTVVPVAERAPGTYTASVTCTMAGTWVVFVSGDLPDGRYVRQQVTQFDAVATGG